ncbi:MAG: hypothetical protein HY951_07500, partial [Bacteroidia bacterium]|nr:hypothetical protein [Bacteroidia bacterium]
LKDLMVKLKLKVEIRDNALFYKDKKLQTNSPIDFKTAKYSVEAIILFKTQGAFGDIKVSGNFFTEKRIASYWIDKNDTNKTNIDFAYYSDIDTIITTFLTTSLTYASFLEVKKINGQKFKVYVDADSAETRDFFNSAIAEWIKNRK